MREAAAWWEGVHVLAHLIFVGFADQLIFQTLLGLCAEAGVGARSVMDEFRVKMNFIVIQTPQ